MNAALERHKGFAFGLFIGALVLLTLATSGLEVLDGGGSLRVAESGRNGRADADVAVNDYERLFKAEAVALLLGDEQRSDVFATTFFNKPKPTEPPPEPPRTRKETLSYLGTINGSRGEPAAFVRVGTVVQRFESGAVVIEDWILAQLGQTSLVLTNATATNVIAFRGTLEIEVPLR